MLQAGRQNIPEPIRLKKRIFLRKMVPQRGRLHDPLRSLNLWVNFWGHVTRESKQYRSSGRGEDLCEWFFRTIFPAECPQEMHCRWVSRSGYSNAGKICRSSSCPWSPTRIIHCCRPLLNSSNFANQTNIKYVYLSKYWLLVLVASHFIRHYVNRYY